MKIRYLYIFLIALLIFGFSNSYLFHEGAVDKRGGHYDSENKEYHYHHGCEPHQHPKGECKFEFKNCELNNPIKSNHDHEFRIN